VIRNLLRDDLKHSQLADKLTAKGDWVSHLVLAEACSRWHFTTLN
jgi:hypothetical protein